MDKKETGKNQASGFRFVTCVSAAIGPWNTDFLNSISILANGGRLMLTLACSAWRSAILRRILRESKEPAEPLAS